MSNIKNREQLLNDPSVLQKIQERAYFIAESAGFVPGRDHDNWVAAEEEVLTKILANGAAKTVKAPAKKATTKAAPEAAAPKVAAKPKAAAAAKTTPTKTAKAAAPKRAPKKSA